MAIELFLEKTVDQNASIYYEKAKKARQKRERVLEALKKTDQKLLKIDKEKEKILAALDKKEEKEKNKRKKEWFEKFRWFMSSEGFLCIGGKDATSNEIVVKKHTEKTDLVLHTDMAGSPFFIIKNGQSASQETINECAQAVASYSRAWKAGITTVDVFYVKPEQVSKKANSGEYMAKGSFMITGETKYIHPLLEIAIGIVDDRIIGGPVEAIKKNSEKYVILVPGRLKTSDVCKKVRKTIGGDLDDIMPFVPAGGCDIRKE